MKKFLNQVWELFKKRLANALIGLLFIGAGFGWNYLKNIDVTVNKTVPEMGAKVEWMDSMFTVKVAEFEALREQLESSKKLGFGSMVAIQAGIEKQEAAKELGDMIRFHMKYMPLGMFKTKTDNRTWYRGVDLRWYHPIFDPSTHYKFINIHNETLWIF